MTETETIVALRGRLAAREAELKKARARLKVAKDSATHPPVKTSISDIQKRYLNAVADLETKRGVADAAEPKIRSSADAVSALANRFNKGIDGVKVERANITVRGDVSSAKKTFSRSDGSRLSSSKNGAAGDITNENDHDFNNNSNSLFNADGSKKVQPAELLVEDDDGLPSWAKNQQKLMIRKENARSSIRDVDVRELQGSMLENSNSKNTSSTNHLNDSKSRDAITSSNEGINGDGGTSVVPRGNVKAALAKWGKTAEEDARIIALKREEEERKVKEAARLKKEREEEERMLAIRKAVEKFAKMSLTDMKDEPKNVNDIELTAFLERKIDLVEKEIRITEQEIEKLELGH